MKVESMMMKNVLYGQRVLKHTLFSYLIMPLAIGFSGFALADEHVTTLEKPPLSGKAQDDMWGEAYNKDQPSQSFSDWIQSGLAARKRGDTRQSFADLLSAYKQAQALTEKGVATGELGVALLQAKRFKEAELWLRRAYKYAASSGQNTDDKYRYAMELGHVLTALQQKESAKKYYQEAKQSPQPEVRLGASISMLTSESSNTLTKEWPEMAKDLQKVKNSDFLADFYLRTAKLLFEHNEPHFQSTAVDMANNALKLGKHNQQRRVQVNALEILSGIYENAGQAKDSLRLVKEAIAIANPDVDQDLLITLEWRRGRLYESLQRNKEAIDAYQRSVGKISEIRFDIPVVYNDGRSSFRETLEPIYLGLANLLLQQSMKDEGNRVQYLQMARDSVESIKQSELQDYLGDRCTVASAQQTEHVQLQKDTAIIYPIVFADRVETLVETSEGIKNYQSNIPSYQLSILARRFANQLRAGHLNLQVQSKSLYDVLLAPFLTELEGLGVKKLVVVPDGVLRLIPYAALYDGKQYAVEKFAFSVSSALSLTHGSRGQERPSLNVLVAGLENPGGVVDWLSKAIGAEGFNAQFLGGAEENAAQCNTSSGSERLPSPKGKLRDIKQMMADSQIKDLSCELSDGKGEGSAKRQGKKTMTRKIDVNMLRDSLRLPGVKDEVAQLSQINSAKVLFDEEFTLSRFSSAVKSGAFNVVHIASHGIFGGSGDNSYLLSHDRVITMNELQNLLRSDGLVGKDIELLSLSACETAEGDDRAPLGISGAALKARAKSVLGTLWPVEDQASKRLMIGFYQNLQAGMSKTESLRTAQLALLKDTQTSAPFYWAPFILVGQWD